MGGYGDEHPFFISSSHDDRSSLDSDSQFSDELGLEPEGEAGGDSAAFGFGEFGCDNPLNEGESEEDLRRRIWKNACSYRMIMRSYRRSSDRLESLSEAKKAILSYTPGLWVDKIDGEDPDEFDVPKTTTLLLVGQKGSGKSSLINRISRVFEDDKLASDRAQVSNGSRMGDGTHFLRGYMVPRRSKSICLFDSRGLSDDLLDNFDLLKSWMAHGVQSGKLVIRDADDHGLRNLLRCKIRGRDARSPARKVDFVIFVVDGLLALKYMNINDEEYQTYAETLARTYNFPYLSFKDDKPVVVITHGDLLSFEERARVRVYLGQLLCVSPTTQIFDIPERSDPVTEMATLQMLTYALERADKNRPRRSWLSRKLCPPNSPFHHQVFKSYFVALIFVGAALGPWLSSTLSHHREARVDGTLDLMNRVQFNATSHHTPSHFEPLSTSNKNQTYEPPRGSPLKPNSRSERRESQPSNSRKEKRSKDDRRTAKDLSRRQNEVVSETEPEINWEARKRLPLGYAS